jgi:hypothetical protein
MFILGLIIGFFLGYVFVVTAKLGGCIRKISNYLPLTKEEYFKSLYDYAKHYSNNSITGFKDGKWHTIECKDDEYDIYLHHFNENKNNILKLIGGEND